MVPQRRTLRKLALYSVLSMIILKTDMLDLITKSKIRQRILLLFIYNPGKEYYINEIAKRVDTSSGTAQRELEKLADGGILTREKKANLVYFKLDTTSNILKDVKNIVDKTVGIEYLLKEALKGNKEIDFIFLFGSYVKGGFNPDSDIDLYIIGDVSEQELHKKIRNVEKAIHRAINYHVASRREFKKKLKESFFHKEIVEQCKLILGDEDEFRAFVG